MTPSYDEIAQMVDHALLSPQLSVTELDAGIEVAVAYNVASVCILPWYVPQLTQKLAGTRTRVSTVIGFPHGGQSTAVKIQEATVAIDDGCEELDMVVNISRVRSGAWNAVQSEIREIINLAHASKRKVKVIFENCYLNTEQKIRLCEICSEASADWVKTSTGFGSTGATLEDVKLMRLHTSPSVQVKAAGGIRDLGTLLTLRELGATRIGLSQTASILDECRERLGLSPIFDVSLPSSTSGY
ncbi:deoxyribose-phosphate aldolase [Planctomicrobium sp. SH668]|uniref:deoxyribose-phosphate aldolase n=1 Tax=Planctomicrobium sp. SH668 TaxID=3448126 RepID=UPI003F5C79E2